jgi:hypothetical protein
MRNGSWKRIWENGKKAPKYPGMEPRKKLQRKLNFS